MKIHFLLVALIGAERITSALGLTRFMHGILNLAGPAAAGTVTVKMETLCGRFYAVISGTSGDINMGSSGECLESVEWYAYMMNIY